MQLFPLRLIPDKTNINFIRAGIYNYIFSIILVIASCVLLITKGLNFGIDFAGGIVIEAKSHIDFNIHEIRESLEKEVGGDITIYNQNSNKEMVIKIGQDHKANQQVVVEHVKILITRHSPKAEFTKIDYVGPQVGSELIKSGIKATVLSFVGIMLYLWFRFEWQYSLGAIIALMHDAIVTMGFFALTNIEFNLTSIAAILTIIGYSVNDSVVIYDRIRENIRKYTKKSTGEVINLSINDTLSRTILTVTTTLLANLALIIYGSKVIESFSLAMFFGIIIGTYSSIFISAPVLIKFGIKSIKEIH